MRRALMTSAALAALCAGCLVQEDPDALERCSEPPAAATSTIAGAVTDDLTPRRVQAVDSNDLDGTFLSAELAEPDDTDDDDGDIATWLIGPNGSISAVDEHARDHSTVPAADPAVDDVGVDGYVESRACVADLRPPGLLEGG